MNHKLPNELIISLTSWPGRIKTVHITIESLFEQSLKADKVILWLASEQFPNKEKDLPDELQDLKNKGLAIEWYKDIRSYKKLIPTLKMYPEAIIVTADDDNIYPVMWLEKLVNSYLKYPKDIHCHRVTQFFYHDGFECIGGGYNFWSGASFLNKLVGLGGVLYPPHCFYKDILDEELFMKLAPTNDDQWFWVQGILQGTKVRVVKDPEIQAHYIPGTQDVGLTKINDSGEHLFWADFNRIQEYYPQLKTIMLVEQEKLGKAPLGQMHLIRNELEYWYWSKTQKHLNLDSPKTFNEKIQWMKLYDSTPIKTRLADKFLVREWIAESIGEKYLIPLLGVYDSFDQIDFNTLPQCFVMKCNHGSGWNIIVKDKDSFDRNEARKKIDTWIKQNYAFVNGCQLHYYNIKPKIVIEKFLENQNYHDLFDYKLWCFNGKVKYIQFLSERNIGGLKEAFYNTNWEKQSFNNAWDIDSKNIKKPDNLEEMIYLAEKLSSNFNYVRVDFYRLDDGTLYFGEMTFTPASGIDLWTDENINLLFGSWIKLPAKAYNIETNSYYPHHKHGFSTIKCFKMQNKKAIVVGSIPIYLKTINHNKKRIKIFNIEIYKSIKTENRKKYYLLGIPVFSKKIA